MRITHPSRRGGLGAYLLSKLYRRPPTPLRRRAFALEGLEDRIAPAVVGNLYTVGTTLVYNGAFANNNISISGTDSSLVISDSTGTINSTVPSFAGNGTGTVTGFVPSYIQTIAIQGQNGLDTINIGTALSTSRNLILGGKTIANTAAITARNVTETAITMTIGANISAFGSPLGPIAGSALFNGTTIVSAPATINTDSVLDGNVTFNGPVLGNGTLTVAAGTGGNVTFAQSVNLGGASGFAVTGNTINLHQIIDGTGATTIFAQNAVNLLGSLVTQGVVSISANQDGIGPEGFTQYSGDILTTSAVKPSVNIKVNTTLGGTGNATLRGITTGAGAQITLDTRGSANSGGAIIDGNGPGVLNANAGLTGIVAAFAGPGGINLDTSTSNLSADVFSGSLAGDVNVRNTGLALTTAPGGLQTSNGNVNLSNNANITVTGANITAGGQGKNVTVTVTTNSSVEIANNINAGLVGGLGTGTATINASVDPLANTLGSITDNTGAGAIVAAHVVLNARDSIGTPPVAQGGTNHPVFISATFTGTPGVNTLAATTSLTTATNGINVSDDTELVVPAANANSGPVNLTTNALLLGTNNLTVNGFVSTANGGAVTLTSSQDIIVLSGSVTSDTGAITLTPARNLTVGANTTVATGNATAAAITVTAPTLDTVIDISGTLAASGGVTINGATGAHATTLGVSGTIASGLLTQIIAGGTGPTVLSFGGTVASGTGTTMNVAGPTTLIATPSSVLKTTGGPITVAGTGGANASLSLAGTITASGAVSISGPASGAGTTVMNITGPITSGTQVNLTDPAAGSLLLSTSSTGAITAPVVVITGSPTGPNVFNIGGPITATAGNITITGGAAVDAFEILGTMSAVAGTTSLIGSATGGDVFVVTPSQSSSFTFQGGAATSALQINTNIGNILSAPADFSTPILFTPASGFLSWTKVAGLFSVTPTVP